LTTTASARLSRRIAKAASISLLVLAYRRRLAARVGARFELLRHVLQHLDVGRDALRLDRASGIHNFTARLASLAARSLFHSAPGARAILLLDQAGWHGAKALKVPSNISLLQLPPRAPELNGQENIWQFMRQNWLSNRIFKSFDDIVDHCCYAWNTLIDQPWKIMSIAHRDWAAAGHSI
jgi:hypothetical protein